MDQKRIKTLRKAVGKIKFQVDQHLEQLKASKDDIRRIKDGDIQPKDTQLARMLAMTMIGIITINEHEAQLAYYEELGGDDDDGVPKDPIPSGG